jgi:hypothetical protein
MAGPYPPEDAAVRVSTTLAGTYTVIGLVTSSNLTEGSSGTSETPYMGGIAYKAGRSTLAGTVNYLFNRADTSGQEVIRAAKRSGASVFLQDCPEGTAATAKVEQFEAKIDEVGRESDAGNDWVTGSFTFTGIPSTLTTETLA